MSKRFGRQQRRRLEAERDIYKMSCADLKDVNEKNKKNLIKIFDLESEVSKLRLRLETPHHLDVMVEKFVEFDKTGYPSRVTHIQAQTKPWFIEFFSTPDYNINNAERIFEVSLQKLADSLVAELKDEAWKGFWEVVG